MGGRGGLSPCTRGAPAALASGGFRRHALPATPHGGTGTVKHAAPQTHTRDAAENHTPPTRALRRLLHWFFSKTKEQPRKLNLRIGFQISNSPNSPSFQALGRQHSDSLEFTRKHTAELEEGSGDLERQAALLARDQRRGAGRGAHRVGVRSGGRGTTHVSRAGNGGGTGTHSRAGERPVGGARTPPAGRRSRPLAHAVGSSCNARARPAKVSGGAGGYCGEVAGSRVDSPFSPLPGSCWHGRLGRAGRP